MISWKDAATASIAAFTLGAATPAGATSVFNADGSVTVASDDVGFEWLVNTDGSTAGSDGMFGQLAFEFTGVNPGLTTFSFSYVVTNTSVVPADMSRLGQFGFNVTGTPVAGDGASDYFQLGTGGNFNGLKFEGVKGRDLCFFVGSNCNGASNDGVLPGVSKSGTFTLTYGTAQSSLQFAGFVTRWQAGQNDASASGGGPAIPPPPPIPEPTTWAMMIGGFGLVGGALRSRRRTTAIA